jgi:hypothetical protein
MLKMKKWLFEKGYIYPALIIIIGWVAGWVVLSQL